MTPEQLNVAAAVCSAVAALASLVVALLVAKTQEKAQRDLALEIQAAQEKLSKRQAIIDIWDKLTSLGTIDTKTSGPAVRHAVNTLELVAVCYEAGAIDKDVIHRTFAEPFVAIYDELHAHETQLPDVRNRTGRELLMENKATRDVYKEISDYMDKLGKVKP